MKDNIVNLNDVENDFGFTFVDESEISKTSDLDDLKSRLTKLRKMFLPLLENLNKNPEKDMIKWPNRKQLLDKQIELLKDLTDV
jgi:hypothetical protein